MQKQFIQAEGFRTVNTSVVGYIKGGTLYLNSPEYRIMVTSESDLNLITEDVPTGTVCFTADGKNQWRLTADKEWESVSLHAAIGGSFSLNPDTMELSYNG